MIPVAVRPAGCKKRAKAFQLPEGFGVGCSVGVAAVRAGIETGEEVLAEVDEALYRAKGDGKGCVAIYAVSSGRVATG